MFHMDPGSKLMSMNSQGYGICFLVKQLSPLYLSQCFLFSPCRFTVTLREGDCHYPGNYLFCLDVYSSESDNLFHIRQFLKL